MAHQHIIREIKAGKFEPIYVLHGDEPFFIEDITQTLKDHVVDEASKDFNESILYGRDVELSEVLAAARRFPMMAERQLVMVKEAQDLKCWRRKDELAQLEAYAENPVGSTVLVLAYMNKKIDGRIKAVKTLSKNGVLFLSEKVRDYKLAQWIQSYSHDEGLDIEPKAVQMLADYLGNDLRKGCNELTKLKLVMKGAKVTSEDIEKHIGISKEYNIFELQKALGTKNVEKATRIVNHFEANPKNNPIAMVAPILLSYFNRVFVYHGLKDKSQSSAAKAMSCSPYAVKEYASTARLYPPTKIARIFGYLREADRKSKGRGNATTTDGMLLREAVFKILH